VITLNWVVISARNLVEMVRGWKRKGGLQEIKSRYEFGISKIGLDLCSMFPYCYSSSCSKKKAYGAG